MTRYTFDEVRTALHKEWGLALHRGGGDSDHDGRWDVTRSKTGFVMSGNMPGHGHRHRRFRSLSEIVRICALTKVIAQSRRSLSRSRS